MAVPVVAKSSVEGDRGDSRHGHALPVDRVEGPHRVPDRDEPLRPPAEPLEPPPQVGCLLPAADFRAAGRGRFLRMGRADLHRPAGSVRSPSPAVTGPGHGCTWSRSVACSWPIAGSRISPRWPTSQPGPTVAAAPPESQAVAACPRASRADHWMLTGRMAPVSSRDDAAAQTPAVGPRRRASNSDAAPGSRGPWRRCRRRFGFARPPHRRVW